MAGAWQPPVGRLPVVSSPCLRRRRGRSLQCSRCVRVDVDGAGAVPVPGQAKGQVSNRPRRRPARSSAARAQHALFPIYRSRSPEQCCDTATAPSAALF